MFTYVISHLLNHAFAVISIEAANTARIVFVDLWTNPVGTIILATAALTHITLALETTYLRRSLRMPVWQWTQLVLGLSIPLLLIEHALATGGGILRTGLQPNYEYVLAVFWYFAPGKGWLQFILLVVAWTHATFGIHHWLKVKFWYPVWQPHIYGIALVIPVMATMGYVSGGFEVLEKIKDPLWLIQMLKDIKYPGPDFDQQTVALRNQWIVGYTALVCIIFLARRARIFRAARKEGIRATYPSGRRVLVPDGATLLETSRAGGIPHASVCGGRGRCSTCRVLILESPPGSLAPPDAIEKSVLDKLKLPPNVRLACQIRPKGNITCEPLLPPDISARDALSPSQFMHGQEMELTVMFVDLRGFTKLSESKLPFDVVFLLNQYFQSMGTAIEGAGGRIDKFIGDGIMALFGIEDGQENGAEQALMAAQQMSFRLQQMNDRLKNDLEKPLRLGIGIHRGMAIVGTMGHGAASQITAIGDMVNTTSRLEALTKDLGVQLLVSSAVEDSVDIDLSGFELAEVEVRGRKQSLRVRKIDDAGNLKALFSARQDEPNSVPT
ncbi:MAG: adenylate/guanylate cyclase domain-containing protein [Rhodospirillales bacterium]|nr:adenylate/guanylate cyclase domain-containing protein [Rhodospirillales bacterium]